jgi:glycolate oxidase
LGLFTRLTIRVIPRPAARGVLFGAFPDTESVTACIARLKRGLRNAPSAIEFIDGETAHRTNEMMPASQRTELPATSQAFLLVEFDGTDTEFVQDGIDQAMDHIREYHGIVGPSGTDPESIERAWRLRKQVPWWVKRSAGPFHSVEDVVVPPAAVPALVSFAAHLRAEFGVPIAIFGHAGDGNFHINPMKSPEMEPDRWDQVLHDLLRSLYTEVVSLGGTISGEHGIGRKRVRDLPIALGPAERNSMVALKRALDPNNVLNPGVVFESNPQPEW